MLNCEARGQTADTRFLPSRAAHVRCLLRSGFGRKGFSRRFQVGLSACTSLRGHWKPDDVAPVASRKDEAIERVRALTLTCLLLQKLLGGYRGLQLRHGDAAIVVGVKLCQSDAVLGRQVGQVDSNVRHVSDDALRLLAKEVDPALGA